MGGFDGRRDAVARLALSMRAQKVYPPKGMSLVAFLVGALLSIQPGTPGGSPSTKPRRPETR